MLKINKKEYKYSLIHALFVFIVLVFVFIIWVNNSFLGKFWGPFLPGDFFGVPSKIEKNIGMQATSKYGWDAQFYYYQSTDPFIKDQEVSKHIDNPSYRYQKIGIPIVVYFISKIFNYEITPPFLYHIVQIFFVSIGFFYLLMWLKEIEQHCIYAYSWLFGAGTLNALFYGMPDMVADSVFIMVLYYIYKKKIYPFLFLATFLLLIREGYAVVIGSLGLYILLFGSYFNNFKNNNKLKELLIISIPLSILFLWSYYIKLQLGIFSFNSVNNANLTDMIFMGYYKTLVDAIEIRNYPEVILKTFGISIILIILTYTFKNIRNNVITFVTVIYILLIASLGTTVWFDYSGYMKAIGSIIVIGIFLLNTKDTKLLKTLLLVYLLVGIYTNYKTKIKNKPMYTPYSEIIENVNNNINTQLEKFNSKIELLDNFTSQLHGNNLGINFLLKEIVEVDVKISNYSEQIFYIAPVGKVNGVYLSYQWIDKKGKVVSDGIRTPLINNLELNGTTSQKMKILVPYNYNKYILVLSFIQEGVKWTYMDNKTNGSFYDFTKK